MKTQLFRLGVLAISALLASQVNAAQTYTFINLGTQEHTYSIANAINNAGQIAGV